MPLPLLTYRFLPHPSFFVEVVICLSMNEAGVSAVEALRAIGFSEFSKCWISVKLE